MKAKTKIIKLPEISYTAKNLPEMGFTGRGFHRLEFTDRYGEQCSLQKSSLATEDAIWLGIDNPEIKEFWTDGVPADKHLTSKWETRTTEDLKQAPNNDICISGRMHLTKDMVKILLPYLYTFVKTGELEE